VSAYIAARSTLSGYAWWEGATRVAADIIARNNPLDMLPLIDSVDIRYSGTRAQFIGTAAVAMKRSGIGSIAALLSRLGRYVDCGQFGKFLDVLKRIETFSTGDSDLSAAAIAKRAVDVAIDSSDLDGMWRASPLVEALPDTVGVPFEGETIWAEDLRRKLADALAPRDPVKALRLIVPITSTEGFQTFATNLLIRHPQLLEPDALAGWALAALRDPEQSWKNTDWVTQFATGFALALPVDARFHFLRTILKQGSPSYSHVLIALGGLEDPIGTLEQLASTPPGYKYDFIVALFNAVQALAVRGDETLFERLDGLYGWVRCA
jgi:hypothetical protein